MRRFVTVAMLAMAACSSSLGSGAYDVPPEGVTAPLPCADPNDPRPQSACPAHLYAANDTALTAVKDVDPVARAALGAGGRWAGRVKGIGVPRPKAAATQATGWVVPFCAGSTVLAIDTSGGLCRASSRCDCPGAAACDGIDCDALPATPYPAVDSDAAILAAFPDDPAGTTYAVSLDLVQAARWTVTREGANPATARVDAATGAVL